MSSQVKTEPEVKQEREDGNDQIKDEPELLSDPEDYLEQDESLDMNLSNGNQKIWLVKLPKYLAEKWQNPELMGKNLGRVKIKNEPQGAGGPKKLQVKLVLDDNENNNNEIPHEYDISILNTQVRNSYVFGEENLKKFKAQNTEMSDNRPEDKPEEDNSTQRKFQRNNKFNNRYSNNSNGINKPNNSSPMPFVKTIPKKTTLFGKICHDCQVRPAVTDNKYKEYLTRRQNIGPTKERPKVVLLDEIPGVVQSNAGPSIKGKSTSVFLKSNANKNKNEGRAIRMPKKDLLDLLFQLFDDYEYWSIRGLRERTRQPESYLKESLDSIANLIKKGPYTSKYTLKPEYKKLRDAERAAKAGININEDENENQDNKDDEDDDEEMEDVI